MTTRVEFYQKLSAILDDNIQYILLIFAMNKECDPEEMSRSSTRFRLGDKAHGSELILHHFTRLTKNLQKYRVFNFEKVL